MQRRESISLRDALDDRSFGHGVLTTFTFDPRFFEDYCLERWRSLSDNGNLSVLVDGAIYDELLVAGEGDRPRLANLRYLLHPMRTAGIFHPKIVLLASRDRGRLLVGSANLTRHGITSNAEMVSRFDYEEGEDEAALPLFQEAFRYCQTLAERSGGDSLIGNLNDMLIGCPWLQGPGGVEPDATWRNVQQVRFLHNLHHPILDQVAERVGGREVSSVRVVSRYFDGEPGILDILMERFAPDAVTIYTQNGTTNLTSQWFDHPLVRKKRVKFMHDDFDDEGVPRTLHAKLLAVETSGGAIVCSGSPNFTTPGLLRTVRNGHHEVALLFDGVSKDLVDSLCNPFGTARPIRGAALQRMKSDEELPARKPQAIELDEARVESAKVILTGTRLPPPEDPGRLVVQFADGMRRDFAIRGSAQGLTADLDPPILKRCEGESATVLVERGAERSNLVLLVYLQDIATGSSDRRRRYILEAQQSAPQFLAVFDSVLASGDINALLEFLNQCEIHVSEDLRVAGLIRRRKDPGSQSDPFEPLGVRNFQIAMSIDGAALEFIRRHQRRLARHVAIPKLQCVPNFMHILSAILVVVESQVRRCLVGLESGNRRLSATEWYENREFLNRYLNAAGAALNTLGAEYVPAFDRDYGKGKAKGAIAADIKPLRDACGFLMQVQGRVEACKNLPGPTGKPFTKPEDVVGAAWFRFATRVTTALRAVGA